MPNWDERENQWDTSTYPPVKLDVKPPRRGLAAQTIFPGFSRHASVQNCFHYDGTFPSLQMAPRRIRGPLAAVLYHDIDVVNAHFAIMMQVATSFRTTLCSVLRVVQERETVLQEVQYHY